MGREIYIWKGWTCRWYVKAVRTDEKRPEKLQRSEFEERERNSAGGGGGAGSRQSRRV